MTADDTTLLINYLTAMVQNEFEAPEEDREFCALTMTAPATLEDARTAVRTAITEQSDRFLEVLFAYLENEDGLSRSDREHLTDFPAATYVGLIEKISL
jgi:hypothetical protein